MLAGELAEVASTPYQCMDIGCLCNYLGGKIIFKNDYYY
jgi:hypothetical protein